MKVQITAESKKVITLALLEPAKRIVSEMKDDPTTLAELGKSASRIASRTCGCFEILKATAEISRNSRIWLQYGDGKAVLSRTRIKTASQPAKGRKKVSHYDKV